MVGARRPELTEGQADCLRLVNAHYTSKQIARQLNISPFTVDQRLDAARKKLSAENRIDALRSEKRVIAKVAHDDVIAGRSVDPVITYIAIYPVVPRSTVQDIAASVRHHTLRFVGKGKKVP